ncbi:MAG: hypothetical protein ACREL3_00835 [Gemmatimonadales bacterium]
MEAVEATKASKRRLVGHCAAMTEIRARNEGGLDRIAANVLKELNEV